MKEKRHIKIMLIVVIIILSMVNLVILFKMIKVEDYSQETFRGDELDQVEAAELVFPAIIFTQG